MVTGNATLDKLLPKAPVKVLMTGNLDSGVNFTGRVYLSLLVEMSCDIFMKTSL
jgi:hypothetical protein